MSSLDIFTIEVSRGTMVESRHHGFGVVIDASGQIQQSWGDPEQLIYPRSAIKPLQTLALIETGAADHFSFTEAELALASASHNGSRHHVEGVAAILSRLGLSADDLECGAHPPAGEQEYRVFYKSGDTLSKLHNNCSGKHAGFLATALHMKEPTAGYSGPDHPVQIRLKKILQSMGDTDLSHTPRGIDGCGIPVMGMSVKSMALGLARMANPEHVSPDRQQASRRIIEAITRYPENVAGENRFDTHVMRLAKGGFVVKGGAEAVYGAIVPSLGLGIALKIEDGGKRASEVVMAAVLDRLGLLDGLPEKTRTDLLNVPVENAAGDLAGFIRMGDF